MLTRPNIIIYKGSDIFHNINYSSYDNIFLPFQKKITFEKIFKGHNSLPSKSWTEQESWLNLGFT